MKALLQEFEVVNIQGRGSRFGVASSPLALGNQNLVSLTRLRMLAKWLVMDGNKRKQHFLKHNERKYHKNTAS